MKLVALAVILTFSSLNNDYYKKFEIIDATSQGYVGGHMDSSSGTYYVITIVPKVNSEVLKFDRVWIGEKYFDVSTFQKGKRVKNDTFGEGDTITIRINYEKISKPELYLKDEKDMHLTEDNKHLTKNPELPFKYKGEALLSYTIKNKRKYKTINKFTNIRPVSYP